MQTLVAGDDPAALDVVASLAQDLGITPIRAGGLAQSADVEATGRVLIAQILERGDFLLRIAITAMTPPDHPGRLGERADP